MKKYLIKLAAFGAGFLLVISPLVASAQSYPSPTFGSLVLSNPLTPANGGTGATTSTGTGSVVLSNSPALTTPNLGTPSVVTLTHGTGLPISTGISGLGAGVATGLGNAATGTGSPVLATSPSIASPAITGGTISGLSAPVPVGAGGTGATSIEAAAFTATNGTTSVSMAARAGQIYNVMDYGADATGTNPSDTAFNAAMTKCSTGSVFPRTTGTMYIPQGNYSLAVGVTWKPGCNILADHGAYIQATANITDLLHGLVGSANSLDGVWLQGGTWACNVRTTAGFTLPDFARINLLDFAMYGCASNGGGFIHLGNASAFQQYEMHISRFRLYNYTGVVPTVIANSYGIYTDAGVSVANSAFNFGEIVGVAYGVYGVFPGTYWSQIHVWNAATQGAVTAGFTFNTYGGLSLVQNEVDSPATTAFVLNAPGQPFLLSNNIVFNNNTNNTETGVSIGTGSIVTAVSNYFQGGGSGANILGDFGGDLSNLSAFGNKNTSVTNNLATAASSRIPLGSGPSLTSNAATNITSFTVNAGNYMVCASVGLNPAASTTTSFLQAFVSTTSASSTGVLPLTLANYALSAGAGSASQVPLGCDTISLSSTTTLYLVAKPTFAVSTMTGYGGLTATRLQ